MQKNMWEDGSLLILSFNSYRAISLSSLQMQASTIMLANESCTSTVQVPSVAIVKLEPTDDSMLVLSDLEDDICDVVDLFDTPSFPFNSRNFALTFIYT